MIRVRLFAALRDLAGASRLELELAPPDVATLLSQLANAYGEQFDRIARAGSVVIDGRAVGPEHRLGPGDEVAVLPPVSGGGEVPGPRKGQSALDRRHASHGGRGRLRR